jgi:hypothetical protein
MKGKKRRPCTGEGRGDHDPSQTTFGNREIAERTEITRREWMVNTSRNGGGRPSALQMCALRA